MLADRLTAGRPRGLPLRHLGRVGHEGGGALEVLADAAPIAEGVGVAHERVGAQLHANLPEGRVGGDGERIAQRDLAVVGIVVVGDGRSADLKLRARVVDGVERGGA